LYHAAAANSRGPEIVTASIDGSGRRRRFMPPRVAGRLDAGYIMITMDLFEIDGTPAASVVS
jgi:hypothetical protein